MGRSPCCERSHTNKGAWTREEDERLVSYIRDHGEGCWRSLPKAAGLLRCGKSCRLRWMNYLRPDLKRGNFTFQEDDLIIKLHSLLGNKWSVIAGKLPGRTDNEIKNYWNTHIKRKLLKKGIDPLTHRPINGQQQVISSSSSFEEGNSSGFAQGDGCDNKELNLELRICPPSSSSPSNYDDDQQEQELDGRSRSSSRSSDDMRRRRVSCFYCNLGLENSNGCSCSSNGESKYGLFLQGTMKNNESVEYCV